MAHNHPRVPTRHRDDLQEQEEAARHPKEEVEQDDRRTTRLRTSSRKPRE